MLITQLDDIYAHNDHPLLWLTGRVACVVFACVLALLMTLALIYLEQFLIDGGDKRLNESPNPQLVEVVRVKEALELVTKKRQPKPAPPDEAPQIQKPRMVANFDTQTAFSMSNLADDISTDIQHGLGFGISDGEYLPLVKVAPVYPRRALVQGLAGWVIVEFTVSRSGAVLDPVVLDHCATLQKGAVVPECIDEPNSIFDRAALQAAQKFRYKPKVIDGEAIETSGVRNKITFVLDA